jgi:hypothetical protein
LLILQGKLFRKRCRVAPAKSGILYPEGDVREKSPENRVEQAAIVAACCYFAATGEHPGNEEFHNLKP